MKTQSLVTIDIGGTKINYGRFRNDVIEINHIVDFCADDNADDILHFIISCIDQVILDDSQAIAIGVPCLVDIEQGIVFDAVNIPAWQKYPLKTALERHYQRDVYINNDVNCFVSGEFCAGIAKGHNDVVGICLGTGFGSALMLNQQLHAGRNCCAGEVGGIAYLKATIDDYCSGAFFLNQFDVSGEVLAEKARFGDPIAIRAFEQFGQHLAQAISYLLFIVDPELIVIGGSVSQSYDLFIDSVWQHLEKFPYQNVVQNLSIEKSELTNAALLGAAHLYFSK